MPSAQRARSASDVTGIALVDKAAAMTSHDVVSRARRALNTRKIGHAGTLDPMATGLLVLGVGPATRLLTYIVGLDKTYHATIRLGMATDTDDADGNVVAADGATHLIDAAPQEIAPHIVRLTGDIEQVPSSVSAIKVDGRRAYDLARAGEEVVLRSRRVTVSRFDVCGVQHRTAIDQSGRYCDVVDVDVEVDCSSGTYIRALARDLGSALGVGGHLTGLRRTRIGRFDVAQAQSVEDLLPETLMTAADVATTVLGRLDVSVQEAQDLSHGKRLVGQAERVVGKNAAAIDPSGVLVGIVEKRADDVKSAMNMPQGQLA